MHGQEPIMQSHVDRLIQRLHERCGGGAAVLNIRDWFNWTAFDIIGDLNFGTPFGFLDKTEYHPLVRMVTNFGRQMAYWVILGNFGLIRLAAWLQSTKNAAASQLREVIIEKVKERIELEDERPYFIAGLIKAIKCGSMDVGQLATNANMLIFAGAETTATLLTGAIYLLAMNPDKLQILAEEVRGSFKSDGEVTLSTVSKLPYMLACLDESLRRYPPIAYGLPRVAPRGGSVVMGRFVPEGTSVAVWQYASNHDPTLWTQPQKFAPERFLGDPAFDGDKLDSMRPFSVGPRDCIGKNLAYAEMRLILAKIIFNFDIRIHDDSRKWLDTQKFFVFWEKPSLNVYMIPVKR
ncbi:cytochrome P450 [Hypoxylon sp. FL1284]|nr:cytochrome P450 [Hypoxylon sp. FL1284]